MPDPRPLTGLYGKVPAHGDFVRRGLPSSFVAPWDAWLQAGMAAARTALGRRWEAAWDGAPPWRFALPAGACGPDAVAGVLLPSMDQVGRRFPVTLAALLAPDAPPPEAAWFALLEAAALAGRRGAADADALAGCVVAPGEALPAPAFLRAPPPAAAPVALPGAEDAWAAASLPAAPEVAAEPGEDPLAPFTGACDAAPGEDVLSLLAGGGSTALPEPGPEADVLAILAGRDGAPEAVDALPVPSAEEPAMAEDAPQAPPMPEGGGWWTGGGGRVPPMLWAWPALPDPDSFSFLIEADAE